MSIPAILILTPLLLTCSSLAAATVCPFLHLFCACCVWLSLLLINCKCSFLLCVLLHFPQHCCLYRDKSKFFSCSSCLSSCNCQLGKSGWPLVSQVSFDIYHNFYVTFLCVRATTITIRTEWVKMGKVSFDLISLPNGKGSLGFLSLSLCVSLGIRQLSAGRINIAHNINGKW